MGWTYTTKDKSTSVKEFFQKEFNHTNAEKGTSGTVLECVVKNYRTAYIAYESKALDKSDVIAIVCLLDYKPNDTYNFGYKDMDEGMGPNEADCPESVLKLLTPTTVEYALNWRKRCEDNLNKLKSAKQIKAGDWLKFKEPFHFTHCGWGLLDTFQFESGGVFRTKGGNRCRLTKWKQREFVVLPAPVLTA